MQESVELRDVTVLEVPRIGRVEKTGDPTLPYRLLDAAGSEVAAVSEFLLNMPADDSPASLRSYAPGSDSRGKAKIGTPEDVPWLFPGSRPGHPLGDDRIGQRLHKIGIRPRQDRTTALFTLAAELPAAVLARVLGVHIQVAVQWQKASAGDWASYAADVSRHVRENQ